MEYGWNFSISGLKMMMKSGLGKIFLEFLHALTMLFLLLNFYFWSKFSNKNDMVRAWRNFKNIFPRPLFIIIFSPEMLKFHPYSILTRQTMVRFVIYCLLRYFLPYLLRHVLHDQCQERVVLVKSLGRIPFWRGILCRLFKGSVFRSSFQKEVEPKKWRPFFRAWVSTGTRGEWH